MATRRGLIRLIDNPRGMGARPSLAVPAAAADDEFFNDVVLLLDWAGVDGGTDTTDLSNSAHVDTFEGDAQIDTAIQSPEATNSLLLDGTGDNVSFPDSVDWDFGTDDFTIEVSVRFASLSGTQTIFGHSGGGADGGLILRFVNPNIVWIIGNSTIAVRSLAPALNTYHHIEISRAGTDLRIFFDGVQSGATVTDSTAIGPTARDLDVGSLVGSTQFLNGLIGAVRITKGVARHVADFTPPTTMYPTSAPESLSLPSIAGLALHLDATEAASITITGSGVSLWEDQSSNGNDVSQSTDANRPTETTINSLNAILFDGSDFLSRLAASCGTELEGPAQTVFAVINKQYDVADLWPGILSRSNLAWTVGYRMASPNSTGTGMNASMQHFSANTAVITTSNTGADAFDIYAFTLVGTDDLLRTFLNGTLIDSEDPASMASVSTFDLVVGASDNSTNSYGLVGSIGEILIYDTKLSDTDRHAVHNYLAAKWQ